MKDAPILRLGDGAQRQVRDFDLAPDADARAALMADLGLSALRKLHFSGALVPEGRQDWRLRATLGATVVQPCGVTLAPVTTRIDEPVERVYRAGKVDDLLPESEMPDDVTEEPLPGALDLRAVLAEALALAVPAFPRAPGAELGEVVHTRPGDAPMRDEDARPFANLRDVLKGKD